MKKSILLVLVLLLGNMAMAQVKVTGTVTSSEDGSPIPYATILVKGVRGMGAATDLDGKFTIERVSPDAVLIFSYIGFITQEIPVNSRAIINVSLEPDLTRLDEVMVVAYGTSTKGTFTGAASVVNQKSIEDVPSVSFEQALTGKVAGMQITTESGQAGTTSSIRVRGIGSMNASNEPLYVIDGVPVQSGNAGQMSDYIYTTSNAMASINPSDIASITVLKDAAASALYGSRAANGVILITTKKGKQGKPTVKFKASVGITPDWAYNNWEPASTDENIEMYYEMFVNAGLYYEGRTQEVSSQRALAQLNNRFNRHGYSFTAPDHTANSLTVGGERAGSYYDWEDALFRTAVYQTYDLAVSGATETTNYYTSIAYTNESGRIKTNEFDRITGRVNLTQKIGKIVEFTTNINIANSNKEGFNDTRNLGGNPFLQTRNLLWGMYWPTHYDTGEPFTNRYGSYAYNPIFYDNEWDNYSKTLRLSASEAITVKILPELHLKSVLSYDNSNVRDHLYYSPTHYNGSSMNGRVVEMNTQTTKLVSSTTLNFNKTFAEKHKVGVLLGWEAEENKTDYVRAEGSDLPTTALHTVNTAGVLDANAYYWGNTMVSALSRAEYNYDDRYYVSASFRRDASSRLAPSSRQGNFWSVAGSWRIDKENFMSNVDFISSLRLRASYGVNGTLPSSNYGWRSLTTYRDKYMELPGGTIATVADENLSWETNYTSNLALEFGLMDQRITGTIEVFNRDSKDLLQSVPISRVTGFTSTLKNVGEINNKGIEIELFGDIIKNRDLTWSAGITASHISSTVTELYGGQNIIWYEPTGGDSRTRFIYKEGESTLAIYGLEWAGVERETGKNLWFLNNEETPDLMVDGRPATYNFNNADEKILGDVHPTLFGGINTNLEWKSLSVALSFTYKIGGYTYDAASRDNADDGYYWERTMSKEQYKHRWTPENKDARLPQRVAIDMTDVLQRSSRHMHPGDYIRLKNINIGYNIPKRLTQLVSISNARVYFAGMNLWTWAKHDTYDPEVNSYGSKGFEVPIGKTYTFGIELSF